MLELLTNFIDFIPIVFLYYSIFRDEKPKPWYTYVAISGLMSLEAYYFSDIALKMVVFGLLIRVIHRQPFEQSIVTAIIVAGIHGSLFTAVIQSILDKFGLYNYDGVMQSTIIAAVVIIVSVILRKKRWQCSLQVAGYIIKCRMTYFIIALAVLVGSAELIYNKAIVQGNLQYLPIAAGLISFVAMPSMLVLFWNDASNKYGDKKTKKVHDFYKK